jgi:hypothetical protein
MESSGVRYSELSDTVVLVQIMVAVVNLTWRKFEICVVYFSVDDVHFRDSPGFFAWTILPTISMLETTPYLLIDASFVLLRNPISFSSDSC